MKQMVEWVGSVFNGIVEKLFSLSYGMLFLAAVGHIAFFSLVFFVIGFVPGVETPASSLGVFDKYVASLYYSTSLASNTGVGDLGTVNIFKILGVFEMIFGIFLFAFVIGKITSRKSDEVLKGLYEMELETTYRNVREELYIARKRLDAIIERTRSAGEIDIENSSLLKLTCAEITSSLIIAPKLLINIGSDSELDRNRQDVLAAIIRRTMQRLDFTIHTFEKRGFVWESGEVLERINRCVRMHEKYQQKMKLHRRPQSTSFNSDMRESAEFTAHLKDMLSGRGSA
ncbi:MAG: hypothetical protein AAB421_01920 [Patescibacteria group bacterium]